MAVRSVSPLVAGGVHQRRCRMISRCSSTFIFPIAFRTPAGSSSLISGRVYSRIATENGESRWITGEADLLHCHRMRALADAVLVGARTVRADDPQLTVRRCAGDNPFRVVIDPELSLTGRHAIFRDRAAPTLIV